MVVAPHDHELVRAKVLLRNVPGLAGSAQADALALPDGVEGEADVLPEGPTCLVDDRPGQLRQVAVQELPERPLADEADTGRVLLRVIWQSGLARDAAHFGLAQAAQREQYPRELLLRQPMQEVALVLGRVLSLEQPIRAVLLDAGVMSGG